MTPLLRRSFHQSLRLCLALGLSAFLVACGSGSNSASNSQPSLNASADGRLEKTAQTKEKTEVKTEAEQPPAPKPETAAAEAIGYLSYERPQDYPKMVVKPLQFITVKGGKKIGVRISLPADKNGKALPGPFPVIVVTSAYNPNLVETLLPFHIPGGVLLGDPDPYFVKRGYAQVTVDSLGTGVSGGRWKMLGYEEQEAYGEAIDWIEKQPWAGEKIGVAGISYMAITGLFTAEQRPDKIDAIFAASPMADAQRDIVSNGGMLNAVFMAHWASLTHVMATQNIPVILANPKHFKQISAASAEHVKQIDDFYLPTFNNALEGHPELTYDSPFWRERSPITHIDRIKAPTFIYSSQRDIFQRSGFELYKAFQKNQVDTRLLIYGGTHISHAGEAFLNNGRFTMAHGFMLQWFDKYLKGMETRLEKVPQVMQRVVNYPNRNTPQQYKGDFYSTTTNWPHPQAKVERWYLHGDMSVDKSAPIATEDTSSMKNPTASILKFGKTSDGTFMNWSIETSDGSRCSPSYEQWTLGFALIYNPRPCYKSTALVEKDALNYETAALAEDYYFNGPLMAELWVSSSTSDAVLSVRIDEVSPGGKVTPVSAGLLLASMRAADTERSRYIDGQLIQPYYYLAEDKQLPLTPGEITKVQLEIFPASAIIRKGHKLRVSIAPSNQSRGLLNYPRQEIMRDAIIKIHHGPTHATSLYVPRVPMSALN